MFIPTSNLDLALDLDLDLDLDLALPGAEELPCSDDTAVDNEDQNDLPNWLKLVLLGLWRDRQDWFFGIDMGVYDREGQKHRRPTVIPDGFLSLGVPRRKRQHGRLSYVIAEEQGIVPILVFEYVSKTAGDEYSDKLQAYQRLGVLYYVLYNPVHWRRDDHDPFEVYRLEQGTYVRQWGEPLWMPEVGLGIGRVQGTVGGIPMEWLAWHDAQGNPYPLPETVIAQLEARLREAQRQTELQRQRAEQAQQQAEQARQQAEQARQQAEQARQQAELERQRAEAEHQQAELERQRADRLAAQLRAAGIEPE